MNTDKCAMQEVGHGFASNTWRGSRSVSIGVDPPARRQVRGSPKYWISAARRSIK